MTIVELVRYEERPVPSELKDVASRLWFLEAPRVRRFEKILPIPFVHLIVNLSDPYAVYDRSGASTQVGRAFLSGIQTEYLVIESPPLIRHVGVELLPAALGAITDATGPGVANRVRDAPAIVPGLDRFVSEIPFATPADALDRMTALLLKRVATSAHRPDPLVLEALSAIDEDPSRPIGSLAPATSPRTLLSRFRHATGLSPKTYAQVVRFHRLVTTLAAPPPTTTSTTTAIVRAEARATTSEWSAVAIGSGFYDQPHVIHAFKRFCGWTPMDYARRVAEFGSDAALFVPLDEVPVSQASS